MTKREFQKAEYENEIFGVALKDSVQQEDGTYRCVIQANTSQEKTCRTCHWWCRGDCVLHTGLIGRTSAKMDFTGILKTKADFGCTEWKREERQNVT